MRYTHWYLCIYLVKAVHMYIQWNLSILVTFGPKFPDLIKQVTTLHRSLCMQMTLLGIVSMASLDRWPYYTVTWLNRFHSISLLDAYISLAFLSQCSTWCICTDFPLIWSVKVVHMYIYIYIYPLYSARKELGDPYYEFTIMVHNIRGGWKHVHAPYTLLENINLDCKVFFLKYQVNLNIPISLIMYDFGCSFYPSTLISHLLWDSALHNYNDLLTNHYKYNYLS